MTKEERLARAVEAETIRAQAVLLGLIALAFAAIFALNGLALGWMVASGIALMAAIGAWAASELRGRGA